VNAKQGKTTRSRRAGVPPALSNGAPPRDFDDGRLEIRAADRVVLTDGRHLQLTPSQLGLLVELLRYAGQARSREQLMTAVWGPDAEAGPRAVDVAIARLRAQLRRRIPGVAYIHTDFRSGYRFEREPAG
jgi:DNA-binding response OmpR family regulator